MFLVEHEGIWSVLVLFWSVFTYLNIGWCLRVFIDPKNSPPKLHGYEIAELQHPPLCSKCFRASVTTTLPSPAAHSRVSKEACSVASRKAASIAFAYPRSQ